MNEKQLTELITEALNHCIEQLGFETPIYIVGIGCNGSITGVRFEHGEEPRVLVETGEDFRLPTNLVIVASSGDAARFLIEPPKKGPPKLRLVR